MNEKQIWVCAECGSRNVSVIAWVDANTYEYTSEACLDDIDSIWCDDCDEHVRLILEKEYEAN